jgi:FixJ family two-component response regulator
MSLNPGCIAFGIDVGGAQKPFDVAAFDREARADEQAMGQFAPEFLEPGMSDRAKVPGIVYVVDLDVAAAQWLDQLLHGTGCETRTFATADEFLRHAIPVRPGCVVVEVDLPGINGLELQKRLRVDRPELPVIFLTGVCDVRTTVRAMKAGAIDFLLKPCRQELLLSAIRTALEASRLALVRCTREADLRRRYAALTSRERDVLALIVAGRLNKQAGAELGISEITVKAHRGSAMRKMEAGSLPELVTMAAELGLTIPVRRPVSFRRLVNRVHCDEPRNYLAA